MNKIDIDKFVASLIEFSPQQSMKYIKALENQGLKYKDGKIVKIEQKSEDEKIRKELINRINDLWENDAAMWPSTLEEKNKYIAWLEKQTNQSEEDETIELLAKDM